MKKLFLLDAFALIYRAHFAFSKNPRYTAAGLNTSAVMGFTNTLLEVLKKEKPSHMAVVFDTSAPTERHVEFEAYKAHREAMPEDLATAIPYIIRLIEGFNIPVISSDGYEADDVIGTLAKKAEQEGFTVFCMTPDKDFAQLVSDNIFIYKPARMGNDVEIMGVKEVLAKWEIDRIDQVIDILGLWGDAVDNIPGIPGIGEKTAKLLIKQYGSMENIIANSHELKGKMRENVENFAQQGLLSKKLATIILDAPVALDPQTLLIEEPDRRVLEPLFAELEFRTLGRRVFGEEFSVAATQASTAAPVHHAAQTDLFGNTVDIEKVVSKQLHLDAFDEPAKIAKNAENTPHSYHLADTLDKQANLISLLAAQSEICFDTETTGTDANTCELVGLSFAIKPGEAWYVPAPENRQACVQLLSFFKPILENPAIGKIGQNIKFDILVLKNYGLEVQGKLFDTMLAHYVLDPDSRHGMDILAENYLGYTPISITTLIGAKGKGQGSMKDVPLDKITEYAAEDADITLQLKQAFEPLLQTVNGDTLLADMEHPLVYVLADMEREGVSLDTAALHE